MINNADVVKAKFDLDAALTNLPANNAIMFGEELFQEFRNREWFTLELFGVVGTTLFGAKVPAYNKTHYVFISWDIPSMEFRVK